ncbi:hypothetical protein [Acinetobacter guillouiae]|uniref:hypothetical protein n=2 Tax=Acinetobacter guillouiae TaxID=106649 RepID=UPI003AF89436
MIDWIKISLLTTLILCVTSCTSTKETQQGKYFTNIINYYFGDYSPNEKVWVDKPYNKYAIAEIKKSKLPFDNFKKIQVRLENDGWKMISDKDSFYEFCLGTTIYMGILYPINPHHYGYDGAEIRYENIDEWSIGLSCNDAGVKHCRKDKLPVIELE